MGITGLSFSFCVLDIIEERVNFDDVEKIVASTACRTIADWKRAYWGEDPERAEKIAWELINTGKVRQPRLDGSEGPGGHSIVEGHWLDENGKPFRLA